MALIGAGKILGCWKVSVPAFLFFMIGFIVGSIDDYVLIYRMVFFVLLLIGFEVIVKYRLKRVDSVMKLDRKESSLFDDVPVMPIILITIISLASFFFVKAESFVVEDVIIYDFRQYFALISILAVSIMADMRRRGGFVLAAFSSIIIASVTDNHTSLIILIFLLAYIFAAKIMPALRFEKYSNYVILWLILMVSMYHVIAVWFVDLYGSGAIPRFNKISRMYDSIYFLDFFLPFKFDTSIVSIDYHNQFYQKRMK